MVAVASVVTSVVASVVASVVGRAVMPVAVLLPAH